MNIGAIAKNTTRQFGRIIKREIDYYRIKPTHALFFMTYRCPSRCHVCQIWKWEKMGISAKDRELGLEDWKRFVDMIAGLKIPNVEIFGGEALLRRDVVPPLVRYISDKGIEADVASNGLTMDESLAQELVDAGLHEIFFSVDGVGEVHDRARGVKGNFEKVRNAIQCILNARGNKNSPNIICQCTISSLNVDRFEEVLPFAAEIGADDVHFEYVGEVKRENILNSVIDGITANPYFTPDDGASFLLDPDQASLLKQKIASIKSQASQFPVRVQTKNIDILTIDDLVNGSFPNKKCYMIRYYIAIDPHGNLMGCPFFNNYHIGNLQDQPIKSLWNGEKHKHFMRAQKQGQFAICRNCIMGVQRNATLFESMQQWYMNIFKTGKDTDGEYKNRQLTTDNR